MFTTLSMFGFFNDWISGFLNAPGAHVWVYVLLGAIIFIEQGWLFSRSYQGIQFSFL